VATQFDQEVIDAIAGYMNGSQAENLLLMVQVLAGEKDATAARMVSFDSEAVTFLATVAEGETEVRLEWPHPCETRADVKDRLFLLLDRAIAAWDGN
jgi:putative heme iron utilization protein